MRRDQGQEKEGGHPGAHIQAHPVSACFASLPFTGTASSLMSSVWNVPSGATSRQGLLTSRLWVTFADPCLKKMFLAFSLLL